MIYDVLAIAVTSHLICKSIIQSSHAIYQLNLLISDHGKQRQRAEARLPGGVRAQGMPVWHRHLCLPVHPMRCVVGVLGIHTHAGITKIMNACFESWVCCGNIAQYHLTHHWLHIGALIWRYSRGKNVLAFKDEKEAWDEHLLVSHDNIA